MKNKTYLIFLTVISLTFAVYNFITIKTNHFIKFELGLKNCVIVSLIGVSFIFYTAYVKMTIEKKHTLPNSNLKLFPILFLLTTVIQFSSIVYEIIENGIGKNQELYLTSLSLLLSLCLIIHILRTSKKFQQLSIKH